MEGTIAVELADGRRILISPSKKKFAEYHPHYLVEGTKIINSVVVGTQYRGVVHNFTRADESELRSQTVTGTLAGYRSPIKRPSFSADGRAPEVGGMSSLTASQKNAEMEEGQRAIDVIRARKALKEFPAFGNPGFELFKIILRHLFPGEEF